MVVSVLVLIATNYTSGFALGLGAAILGAATAIILIAKIIGGVSPAPPDMLDGDLAENLRIKGTGAPPNFTYFDNDIGTDGGGDGGGD